MGAAAQILLVSLLLATTSAWAQTTRVNDTDYRAFWLWSGVRPSAALREAEVIYLHQGDVVTRQGKPAFVRLGQPVARLRAPALWLTVRLERLDLSDEMLDTLARLPVRWAQAGNPVTGLQIDFDAATRRIGDYGHFLTRLRARLDGRFGLGVTGLLDWAQTGSVAQLNALPVDELVVQTYQGRHTVPGYARYLPALLGLRVPFKIGIAQNGEWDKAQEKTLAASPWYRGAVIFVMNDER
ncbi:DUF3142 domain-containing protein [Cronobacter sakazakii]|uniref:DUF3142 domain-containing protein n=2 Tax=Cronobacter sakazakii TaxID=28141 RepID=A7MJX2_CROS8|nr:MULTISPECIES: DUF3142 domain-containing protein [Cronobacter]ABU78009.1 hypothetical protein ESA_02778 [Cronobacter sakazakii ATCC BAA-894]AXX01304.1 DUF3142 domain-containing protein [Cronobacter sakazakii]EGT4322179.1 DUF3142 domain-containing protein [Cronobacter sakazakii]EGT4951131.1 DUF3142 domain-containing protein [Cronobacter sakazakii]EGT5663538.1 DUF3142 domain-containing protein [Cronobacter sakazakii]